ncbi:MAG: hypothetical protein ABIE42_05795 [Candidatus Eisenbacteria bacterium]
MKRTLITAIVVAFAAPAAAQEAQPRTVSVPESMLTETQKAEIGRRDLAAKVEQYGEWVGLGGEIGKAVDGALAAVTDRTAEFAKTDVGKLTVALVVWKVVAKDILAILICTPLLGVLWVLTWKSYRRACMGVRRLKSRAGGWWVFGGKREYEYEEPTSDSGEARAGAAALHFVLLAAATALLVAVMLG